MQFNADVLGNLPRQGDVEADDLVFPIDCLVELVRGIVRGNAQNHIATLLDRGQSWIGGRRCLRRSQIDQPAETTDQQ